MEVWFEKGISHRSTGPFSPWASKPLRLKVAIILAANATAKAWIKADVWELLTPACQEKWLAAADRRIAEGVTVAGEGGQDARWRSEAA